MTDREPIAVCALSNHGGVEIFSVNYGIEDSVDWRYYGKECGTSVIEYEPTDGEYEYDRAYFMIGEIKIYLDECMRI